MINFILTTKTSPAWLKRFSFITSSSQSKSDTAMPNWKSSKPTKLDHTATDEDDLNIIKLHDRQKASAWAQKALFNELITYIEDTISGQASLGFTTISTSTKSWDAKNANAIFKDVTALIKELSKKYQIDLITDMAERKLLTDDDQKKLVEELEKDKLLTEKELCDLLPPETVKALLADDLACKLFEKMDQRDMTLMVPKNHKAELLIPTDTTHTNSAQDLLTIRYPGLKIAYCDDMVEANDPFALLIFDKGTPDFNNIGYLELQVSTKQEAAEAEAEENQATDTTCKLDISAYRFVILHPDQIAVLTGI